MSSSEQKLLNLLEQFELPEVYKHLQENGVTFDDLKYIDREDLRETISSLGLRIRFREKLFQWRKIEYGTEDETRSVFSNFSEWLGSSNSRTDEQNLSHSQKSNSVFEKHLQKDFLTILKDSLQGRAAFDYYAKYCCLNDEIRKNIINAIVECLIYNQINVRISDFSCIVNEILALFPTERGVQDENK